jgi:hypothetical protein
MHWRRYGYFNYHSPADHDGSTDSGHWGRQLFCHYEVCLWSGYTKIRLTISSVQSSSTIRTSILSDPSTLHRGGNRANHQKLFHYWKLYLAMSPHRARCLDYTGLLTESIAMQPVPLPAHLIFGSCHGQRDCDYSWAEAALCAEDIRHEVRDVCSRISGDKARDWFGSHGSGQHFEALLPLFQWRWWRLT